MRRIDPRPEVAAEAALENDTTLTERIQHVVQSCFNGRRIVIFSGGEAKDTPSLMQEVKEIAAGGAFGSIMGRNAFQRPRADALKLLGDVIAIYKNA